MFERDEFIEACLDARRSDDPVTAVRDVVAKTIVDPAGIDDALGAKVDASFGILHVSDELLIQRAVFPVGFRTGLHEHRLWTISGVYAGVERHARYRVAGDRLEPAGTEDVAPTQTIALGPDMAHDASSVGSEPLRVFHVYLGNLFTTGAGEWDEPNASRREFSDAWLTRLIDALQADDLVVDGPTA